MLLPTYSVTLTCEVGTVSSLITVAVVCVILIVNSCSLFSIIFSAAEGADEEDCGNVYDRIVYDNRLGLAVERMQEGLTLESLWKVV